MLLRKLSRLRFKRILTLPRKSKMAPLRSVNLRESFGIIPRLDSVRSRISSKVGGAVRRTNSGKGLTNNSITRVRQKIPQMIQVNQKPQKRRRNLAPRTVMGRQARQQQSLKRLLKL